MGFLSANGAPREYHGEYTPSAFTNIDGVKSNRLGRDVERMHNVVNFTPRNQAGTIPAGEIRRNVKFAAFWCVFLTKRKVDPESW